MVRWSFEKSGSMETRQLSSDITNINNRKSLVYLAPMRPTSLDSLFPLVASPDKYAGGV